MKIIKCRSYDEVNRHIADLILTQIHENRQSVLGLATGSTPVGAYKLLIEACKEGKADFSEIKTVNLDEYVGLPHGHEQSYRCFMDKNLFRHININHANTHVPGGSVSDEEAECKKYEELIERLGGIDLQLLGMGHNGHIAFNEPAGELIPTTHVVKLAEQTIKANSRFFAHIDAVPKSAITMGIKTIMRAKKILLAVSGNEKADMLKKALFGSVTTQIPASLLQLHRDLIVVTDCF